MSGFHDAGKRKKLGQNFLVDDSVVRRIVAAARVGEGDRVLEVGPGKGVMTRMLAATGATVTAVELDGDLYGRLVADEELASKVTLVRGNALKVDLSTLDAPYHVVANLPYSVGGAIVERLIGERTRVARMTVMLQAEVGRRMVAKPGESPFGTLSLFIAQYCDGELLFTVPPEAFRPAPKVDSVVIRLTPLAEPRVNVDDEVAFFAFIHEAFVHRRKTLWNNLRERFGDRDRFDTACEKAGVPPTDRPERVGLAQFAALYEAWGAGE
ncbi:MAG: ribosomal RNA small subunit methyltransferase A [Nitrospinae bacterium]|nr:ribosomal RNA small subunit methyltransferase A [Nitrospinota bacterium]